MEDKVCSFQDETEIITRNSKGMWNVFSMKILIVEDERWSVRGPVIIWRIVVMKPLRQRTVQEALEISSYG